MNRAIDEQLACPACSFIGYWLKLRKDEQTRKLTERRNEDRLSYYN